MTNPIIREHNQETGEVVDREMTDAEFADYQAAVEARAAESEAKETAKADLLARLGITAEEAALLLA